jgi:hypothetical protein
VRRGDRHARACGARPTIAPHIETAPQEMRSALGEAGEAEDER